MFDYLANPTRFMRLADWLLRPIALLATALILAGLYYGLFDSPPDYQQGETVRIMYVHVPAAWLASLGYVALGLCGLFYVVWRHPLADVALRAMAPVGAMFAFLTRSGGVSVDPAMLTPLLLMLAGTHCYFVVIVILRMKAILAERRIVSLQLRQAAREAG